MNAKEAREIMGKRTDELISTKGFEVWLAQGYLEALEGEEVKALVEALEAEKLASLECVSGYDSCDSMFGLLCDNHSRIKRIDNALAQYREAVKND